MSLESTLERIAVALEQLAGFNESKPGKPAKRKTSGKKSSSASAAKPDADTAESTPAPENTNGADELTADDVREALVALGKRTDTSTARASLKEYGYETISKIPEDKYADAIGHFASL